jgi:hypothetical protein
MDLSGRSDCSYGDPGLSQVEQSAGSSLGGAAIAFVLPHVLIAPSAGLHLILCVDIGVLCNCRDVTTGCCQGYEGGLIRLGWVPSASSR